VNHAEEYVNGNIHTNEIENFWSPLKRGLKGTYVSVEPLHLFRYLDEQAFRYNERKGDDGDRFIEVASTAFGRRLTYKELTGKDVIPTTSRQATARSRAMPKKKMKFPEVPGDTARERFMNLARHVISAPAISEDKVRRRKRTMPKKTEAANLAKD